MLNEKVEHCPNCGRIKNKFKACKSCGFGESGETVVEDCRETLPPLVSAKDSYFVTYAACTEQGFRFGSITINDVPKLTSDTLIAIQNVITQTSEDFLEVHILNMIKLEK